ncbi:MAG: cytochrome c peroxidase [Phycisphaerales bacterium JB054]
MKSRSGCRRAFARLAPTLLLGVPLAGTIGVTATWALDGPTAALPPVPEPAENPITEEKRILGKMLFWDEQLSTDGTTACGTCHIPAVGGIDPRAAQHPGFDGIFNTDDDVTGSFGVVASDANDTYQPDPFFGLRPQVTDRTAPPSIMAMYAERLFWDGRAGSEFLDPETGEVMIAAGGALENQVLAPPMSPVEMAHAEYDWPELRSRLTAARPLALAQNLPADLASALSTNPTYPDLFAAAFGDGDITATRIAFAIATYERTLNPDQTPLDRFVDGDGNAMTQRQQQGFNLFLGSACAMCHTFPLFTDNQFRNIGVRPIAEDRGLQDVTGLFADRGKFKVPSLRNVGLRPRMMHNGDFTTMQRVFDFYARRNGQIPFEGNIDPLFDGPIAFPPQQEQAIIDFLTNALTDPRVANEQFPFDRPVLHQQKPQPNPLNLGGGRAGSSGQPPVIIADRPPYLGNQWFQLGLDAALADTQAWLAVSASPPQDGEIDADELLGPFAVDGAGLAGGFATGPSPIAMDPSLDGQVRYMQWIVEDAGAPGGQAKSAVVRVTLFCGNGQCFCTADFNRDTTVNTLDVLGFLNAWAAGALEADTDRNGTVNTLDVLQFLNRWNAGC